MQTGVRGLWGFSPYRETREHSGHYLQALLVQSGERRNAENLDGSGVSPRDAAVSTDSP